MIHFVSEAHAIRYYAAYESGDAHQRHAWAKSAVAQKLKDGEIKIGPPALKPGETLRIIDGGTRYAIVEGSHGG